MTRMFRHVSAWRPKLDADTRKLSIGYAGVCTLIRMTMEAVKSGKPAPSVDEILWEIDRMEGKQVLFPGEFGR